MNGHRDRMWAVCLRLCGSTADAEDALQEALISAWRKLGTFRGDAKLSTFVVEHAVFDIGEGAAEYSPAHGIEFSPPLSGERREAVDRLGMGLLDKMYLKFDEIFWETDVDVLGYIGPERGHFAEWLNIAKYTGEPILLGFNASSAAEELETMTDEQNRYRTDNSAARHVPGPMT
jgi:hypothetical protein